MKKNIIFSVTVLAMTMLAISVNAQTTDRARAGSTGTKQDAVSPAASPRTDSKPAGETAAPGKRSTSSQAAPAASSSPAASPAPAATSAPAPQATTPENSTNNTKGRQVEVRNNKTGTINKENSLEKKAAPIE